MTLNCYVSVCCLINWGGILCSSVQYEGRFECWDLELPAICSMEWSKSLDFSRNCARNPEALVNLGPDCNRELVSIFNQYRLIFFSSWLQRNIDAKGDRHMFWYSSLFTGSALANLTGHEFWACPGGSRSISQMWLLRHREVGLGLLASQKTS